MTTPLRFALVGAGGIAPAYGHVLGDLDEAVAVGVVDPAAVAGEEAAEMRRCRGLAERPALDRTGGIGAAPV